MSPVSPGASRCQASFQTSKPGTALHLGPGKAGLGPSSQTHGHLGLMDLCFQKLTPNTIIYLLLSALLKADNMKIIIPLSLNFFFFFYSLL